MPLASARSALLDAGATGATKPSPGEERDGREERAMFFTCGNGCAVTAACVDTSRPRYGSV